jgi:YihY family inner membrane protein
VVWAPLERSLNRADRWQRPRRVPAVAVATVKRFGEDGAGQLAAQIAYNGFLSLFPLLLVLASVLGFIVHNDPSLQRRILDSALSQFPIVGTQIRSHLGKLGGSGVALAFGLVGALWGGLGGVRAAQNAMDGVWDVPMRRRPGLPRALMRSLLMLSTLGTFLLASSILAGVAGASGSLAVKVASSIAAAVINVMLFATAFRILTVADVGWSDALPGAVLSGVAWTLLLMLGGWIVGSKLQDATELYGFFGIVIGLLAWIYLGAQVTLLGAELNVVLARRLWPRALRPDDRTDADERVLTRMAKVEERREEERVNVRFEDQPDRSSASESAPTERAETGSIELRSRRSLGQLVGSVLDGVRSLFRKEAELAKLEVVDAISARAVGAGMFGAAGVMALFAVGFLAAAGAAGLAIVLPTWAAIAIVGAAFAVAAGVTVLVARRRMDGPSLTPEETKRTLQEDVRWAKQQIKR